MSDLKKDPAVKPGTKGNAAPEESESMRRMEKDADKMAIRAVTKKRDTTKITASLISKDK